MPSCNGKSDEGCFTDAEKKALADIRRGPPIKGTYPLPQYWDTLEPSTTTRWLANADASPLSLTVMAQSFFKYAAFFPQQNPDYNWQTFDFERDPARMTWFDEMMNPKPEFDAFRERGSKILSFWGWSDTAINPAMGITFYKTIIDTLGLEATHDFYRLFFLPGVANCSGGYGPDEIDIMTPLIEWVETGHAPRRLQAQKTIDGQSKYNRAYCPFPQKTIYARGDAEYSENWFCDSN